jgi:hypothetical protein
MADTTLLVAGGIALVLAIASWLIDLKAAREHAAWLTGKTRTEGTVVRVGLRDHLSRNEPVSDEKGRVSPVIRFRAANSVEYEFDAPDAPTEIGSVVQIAYEPALPSNARAVARTPKIGCAIVFLAGALVLLALAFFKR